MKDFLRKHWTVLLGLLIGALISQAMYWLGWL